MKTLTLQQQAEGAFLNVCQELELNESFNFTWLVPVHFHMLKDLIFFPIMQKQNTNYQYCISVGEPPIRVFSLTDMPCHQFNMLNGLKSNRQGPARANGVGHTANTKATEAQ